MSRERAQDREDAQTVLVCAFEPNEAGSIGWCLVHFDRDNKYSQQKIFLQRCDQRRITVSDSFNNLGLNGGIGIIDID